MILLLLKQKKQDFLIFLNYIIRYGNLSYDRGTNMGKLNTGMRKKLFQKLSFGQTKPVVTDDEVDYFSKNPAEIDEYSAPLNIHKLFLIYGAILGIALVWLSKLFKCFGLLAALHIFWQELIVDLVYESGVALIGSALAAFLLGILLNQQQKNAKIWRAELRMRINEKKSIEGSQGCSK